MSRGAAAHHASTTVLAPRADDVRPAAEPPRAGDAVAHPRLRVLLVAPHPFYQERGTPIATDLLVRVLSEEGHEVDVLTYHEGSDRAYPGVTIHRIPRWIGVRGVPPGPTWKKFYCDAFLIPKLLRLVLRRRYDIVHAVEEAAFMALAICPLLKIPFVYDMDSSIATQMLDRYRWLRPVARPLRWIETLPMRAATAVVPMCDALAETVRGYRKENVVVLKDVSLVYEGDVVPVENLRDLVTPGARIVMYIGNLEHYQGIDLMLESFAIVRGAERNVDLVIIGGSPDHIAHYQALAGTLGVGDRVHFIGPRPIAQIGGYMEQADVLVSPRTQGQNTPMKVYSYLHSGVAVLATDRLTHTQVMTPDIAMLTAPDPESFGAGMAALLDDPDLRARLGRAARDQVERAHSYEAFRTTVSGLYENLRASIASSGAR